MSNEESSGRDLAGCFGSVTDYDNLTNFLKDSIKIGWEAERQGWHRSAICIWGHAGIGKTSIAKDLARVPVTWNGNKYKGHQIFDVPIAQFEEMGDIHGMPTKMVLMRNPQSQDEEGQWVPTDTIEDYARLGWEVDTLEPIRTKYAIPDWVPIKPGPSILLFDDWNRAALRIIKGCMQLIQNYGTVSWKLPPGCTIIVTGNPDEQDYLVTNIDDAILTRFKSVTLEWGGESVKQWAPWADANGVDSRVINYALSYPEMMIGPQRTNPRSITDFGRAMSYIGDIEGSDKNKARAREQAHASLDEETVSSIFGFFSTEMEKITEPEEILRGDKSAAKHILELMEDRKEPRVDVVNIILERLFARCVNPKFSPSKEEIKNFQDFITLDCLPDDTRHAVCRRMHHRGSSGSRWLVGNITLRDLIMETMR